MRRPEGESFRRILKFCILTVVDNISGISQVSHTPINRQLRSAEVSSILGILFGKELTFTRRKGRGKETRGTTEEGEEESSKSLGKLCWSKTQHYFLYVDWQKQTVGHPTIEERLGMANPELIVGGG